MGGSAPRLRHFKLADVRFPELPKLHLFAPHLVHLTISHTRLPWFISSEGMAALLSALSSLKTVCLEFESLDLPSGSDRESPPSSKRSISPALESFGFRGDVEYLVNLVTFIDAPQLDSFICFFDRIDVKSPRLAQFVHRTPTLGALDQVHMQFGYRSTSIGYSPSESSVDNLWLGITCRQPDWELLFSEQVFNSLHPLSTVENFYIEHSNPLFWDSDAVENTSWLELLLPSTAVKNLYLPEKVAPGIADALQELGPGRMTELLPGLESIFVEGLILSVQLQENIQKFVAARHLSGHVITVSLWVMSRHQ